MSQASHETEPWTVGRLLKWTTDFLAARDIDSPRLEAEVLLAHALKCQRIELYTRFDEAPGDDARGTYRSLVKKRSEGMPVAYLVGYKEFYSLPFRVTPDVLIPRPETEFLVIAARDLIKQSQQPWRVLDVGTGSGILAICLAKQAPKLEVTAVDLSPAALEVARENAQTHGVAERIRFLPSDVYEGLAANEQFDLIVSNPPYITTEEMQHLDADVRDYEPHMALEAGPQGTEVIERLLTGASTRLRPGGHLLFEISPMLAQKVQELVPNFPQLRLVTIIPDLSRLARVAHVVRTD